MLKDRFAALDWDLLNLSYGSCPDSQSGELAASLPSFELMTPVS
jgi:hypothetical protein